MLGFALVAAAADAYIEYWRHAFLTRFALKHSANNIYIRIDMLREIPHTHNRANENHQCRYVEREKGCRWAFNIVLELARVLETNLARLLPTMRLYDD